jgi:hypothetical protein
MDSLGGVQRKEKTMRKARLLLIHGRILLGVALLIVACRTHKVRPQEVWTTEFPPQDIVAACACHDSQAVLEFVDLGKFTGEFDGSITVRTGAKQVTRAGFDVVPLNVTDYSTTSNIQGLGKTVIWLDKERNSEPSLLREKSREGDFPATQEMVLNVLMTTEALPGVTLRSLKPAFLRNDNVTSFPPQRGAAYTLTEPVELEDVSKPGKVAARIVSVNTSITSSRIR